MAEHGQIKGRVLSPVSLPPVPGDRVKKRDKKKIKKMLVWHLLQTPQQSEEESFGENTMIFLVCECTQGNLPS